MVLEMLRVSTSRCEDNSLCPFDVAIVDEKGMLKEGDKNYRIPLVHLNIVSTLCIPF